MQGVVGQTFVKHVRWQLCMYKIILENLCSDRLRWETWGMKVYKNLENAPECIPVSTFYGLCSESWGPPPSLAEQEHQTIVPARLQYTVKHDGSFHKNGSQKKELGSSCLFFTMTKLTMHSHGKLETKEAIFWDGLTIGHTAHVWQLLNKPHILLVWEHNNIMAYGYSDGLSQTSVRTLFPGSCILEWIPSYVT